MEPGPHVLLCVNCGAMFRCETYPDPPLGPCANCDDEMVVLVEEPYAKALRKLLFPIAE